MECIIYEQEQIVEEYNKGMFIEVAGQIRKRSHVPYPDGTTEVKYIPWSLEAITRRYGKDRTSKIIAEMPNYDGEVTVPQNIDYHPVIGRYINAYQPLRYKPMAGANWSHIQQLLKHIFEEHYEYGLDYVQLLYIQPTVKLPVILLVSEETGTGKSTFCNLLKEIFGANATELTNDNLRSQFTSTWMSKLVVYVEETLLDRREDSEKIKNLVTALKGQSEAKCKDRIEVPLFAKFIMCSNDEDRPVVLSPEDSRFWVRKVKPIKKKRQDEDFFEECKKEIPYFLYYLTQRQLSTTKQDRLWFARDLIVTDAWRRIVNNSRTSLEMQMAELLTEIMENCNQESLCYTTKDLLKLLEQDNIKCDRRAVIKVLKNKWKLQPLIGDPKRYFLYLQDFSCSAGYSCTSKTGRYYEIKRELLHTLTI